MCVCVCVCVCVYTHTHTHNDQTSRLEPLLGMATQYKSTNDKTKAY